MITIVITIKMEKKKKIYTINDKKTMGIKILSSPKEKLELGKVLKVEIGKIRVIAPLIFDLFVLLSN